MGAEVVREGLVFGHNTRRAIPLMARNGGCKANGGRLPSPSDHSSASVSNSNAAAISAFV